MGPLFVAAFVLAACGYEHGQLGRDPGDVDAAVIGDGRMLTGDGAVAIDAPDPTKSWVAIETITVPVNGTTMTSASVLANGVTYKLRASGQFVIQSPQGTPADAEWWDYVNNQPTDGVTGVDCGLAVNDPVIDDVRTPKWGAYASSHVYEVSWTGAGATIVTGLHDGNLTNNTGSLTLTILAYQ